MTASERLTELHTNRLGYTDAIVVIAALPAITAVVAAAEQRDDHADDCLTRLDRWCDCGRSDVLDAALDELNRVLGDKP